MDIERMHEMMEALSENVIIEFNKGIECIDTCEMASAIDMIKDLSTAIYYRTVTESMNKVDNVDTEKMLSLIREMKNNSANWLVNISDSDKTLLKQELQEIVQTL